MEQSEGTEGIFENLKEDTSYGQGLSDSGRWHAPGRHAAVRSPHGGKADAGGGQLPDGADGDAFGYAALPHVAVPFRGPGAPWRNHQCLYAPGAPGEGPVRPVDGFRKDVCLLLQLGRTAGSASARFRNGRAVYSGRNLHLRGRQRRANGDDAAGPGKGRPRFHLPVSGRGGRHWPSLWLDGQGIPAGRFPFL